MLKLQSSFCRYYILRHNFSEYCDDSGIFEIKKYFDLRWHSISCEILNFWALQNVFWTTPSVTSPFNMNTTCIFKFFREFLPQDVAPHLQKGSSVVLISSIEGYNPSSLLAMYGVTKTALLGLTKVKQWLYMLFFFDSCNFWIAMDYNYECVAQFLKNCKYTKIY